MLYFLTFLGNILPKPKKVLGLKRPPALNEQFQKNDRSQMVLVGVLPTLTKDEAKATSKEYQRKKRKHEDALPFIVSEEDSKWTKYLKPGNYARYLKEQQDK